MHILVIEDDRELCHALQLQLAARNHTADCCHTGTEALYYAGKDSYDLILLADETGFRTRLIRAGFVAAASHELRSPLAVIRTSAAALLDSPEHSPRLADTIISECRRGGRLIKSLLLMASADDQTLDIKQTRFELDELLLNLLELYEPLCRSRGANLLLELPGEPLPSVCADQDMCWQILIILLYNAIAHGLPGDHSGTDKETAPRTRDREKIVIKAEYDQKHVSVSVIDHSPGHTDAEKGLVFDRFYRKDKSRNSKEHFGLGLSIAASLAGVQKLKLSAEDTKGGGCTFRLEF
ncbi:MAG TPA: hybrid sensor histidine kinase/response regulator [Candidatus Mediterraneibacter avicola]|nr:hybrid sensor histidine kinase/response regulator [Candidatus Mediterraneibacter avicola]